jgi:hypothetical protein
MEKDKIKSINVEINGKIIELNIKEAKELFISLAGIFKKDLNYIPTIPQEQNNFKPTRKQN